MALMRPIINIRKSYKKSVEHSFQPDICFVIKSAKAFGFFTQVLRQFLPAAKNTNAG